MRRHAFPAIVGVTVTILVAVMIFLVFGLNRFLPVIATTSFGAPAKLPDIPVAQAAVVGAETDPEVPGGGLTEAEIEAAWASVAKAAADGHWQSWGQVVDADTGVVLFSADASGLHTPASTQKILTARFALAALDPEQTLTTGVSRAGSDIYLWGEGDLLLSASAGNPAAVNGHAGVGDLAQQTVSDLAAAGITSVNLHYQETLFDGPLRSPAWEAQDVLDFAGDAGPYAIDTGRVAPGAWEFVPNSAVGVADTLAAALIAQGIAVTSSVPGTPAQDATKIATVQSAPVIDQIQFMVETSDNTLAEQYCHLATAASTTGTVDYVSSAAAMKSFAVENGVEGQKMVVADCSGLDSDSRLTAEVLTQTILAASRSQGSESSLVRTFPVGGMNGTLATRFEDAPERGNVNAKTGSLGNVSTLAGVLTTASGQNLVFAVGNDHVPDDAAYWTKPYLDEFIEFLAQS